MPALWQTGFRPFFLVAAVAAVTLPGLWVAVFLGWLPHGSAMPGVVWHAHEMLLGFTSAVVAGFLLTAVRSWSGRPTLDGAALGGLVAIWVLGRLTAWLDVAPWVSATVDAAFFVGLAVGIGRPLVAARNHRNLGFIAVALLLGGFDATVHLAPTHALQALRGALDAIVVVMVVITGRIVPMFTANALPAAAIVRRPTLDRVALAGALLMMVAEAGAAPEVLVAGGATAAGLAVFGRGARWAPRSAIHVPLLAILHVGHAWLGLGLLLRAASVLGAGIPASAATHALTAGAIGSLTLGMMARVSLGHTGRPLLATRATTAAFGLITLAAALRTAAATGFAPSILVAAATAWGLAFLVWVGADGLALLRPRPDGRPG